MDYKPIILGWFILATCIIYWDINRWKDNEPLSACCNSPIKTYHERPMCVDCKLFCKIKGEEDGSEG